MTIIENSMIGIGLSMDAFMIAFSQGYKWKSQQLIVLAMFFGFFQFFMNFIGYHFGQYFIPIELPYKNIMIFLLLMYIGIKMMSDTEEEENNYNLKTILFLSLLTSMDALSIGISLSLYVEGIIKISLIIGTITLFLSLLGSLIGNYFRNLKLKNSNKIGGIIIILYAIKILLSS